MNPRAPASPPPPPSPDGRRPRPPAPGQQLLIYTPDGPLGGTFTCTACGAQAWQPDLLAHAEGCGYRPGTAAPLSHPRGG